MHFTPNYEGLIKGRNGRKGGRQQSSSEIAR